MSHKSDLIEKDILAYLKEHEQKQLVRFITCGSVDDGKSTLIGRLLHDSKLIYEDQLASIRKDSKYKGSSADNFDLALLVDGLQAEREQGITIDVAYRYFSTSKRKFIIADTPGHIQYTRNMATGASSADLAIILIDARYGVLTQTRRHSYIVSLLGIRHIVVAVNKMDIVDYEESVFNKIVNDYKDFCNEAGIDSNKVYFVPMSALKGSNVVEKSPEMPWYKGTPLMDILETIEIDDDVNYKDFRLPVQYVNRPDLNFRGFCGTIASGSVKVGDSISVLPSGLTSSVKSIIENCKETDEASAGYAVTLTMNDEIDVSRGDMIVKSDSVPEVGDCFDAYVVWMAEEELELNKAYYIKRAATKVTGFIDQIHYKVDVNTLEKLPAQKLALNEIAYCRINLSSKIAYDTYKDHRYTGSLIFIDRITNNTCGAAMIDRKNVASNVIWHKHKVEKAERCRIKGHRPCVIWLTGLSGSGKSTISNALEERLNRSGIHTYLLDGDNVRHGLNKDLGFSEADRNENIRRIGEVAKLFSDAGLVVITAFISPFRAEREMVRSIMEEGEFVEVYVNAPLDVCEKRDPKNLYKKARKGEIKDFTGISSPYEEPLNPEIEVSTHELSVDESVEKILKHLNDKKLI
ncbi:MAG: sulfate adenylyltransferase subunit CysN [Deferribacterales bacterium]